MATGSKAINTFSGRTQSFFKSNTFKEFLSEMIGTYFLMTYGMGAIASYVLKNQDFDHFSIAFTFGVGALIGITASIKVSGAHINPAVTVALACVKKFPWLKVGHYLIGQYLGAFLGAGTVYLIYYEGIDRIDPSRTTFEEATSTGKIFATYPAEFVTFRGALIDQILGTALLMFAVLAVTDEKRIQTPVQIIPFIFALVITGVVTGFAINCGAVLNPARDFAPRLFTSLLGYGWKPFEPLNGHYWWVAGIVGPHIGAVVGAWLYLLTIDHENIPFFRTSKPEEAKEETISVKAINLGLNQSNKDEQLDPKIIIQ